MEFFQITAVIIVLCAVFAYFNQRYIKMPSSITLMIAGLAVSLTIFLLHYIFPAFADAIEGQLAEIDFSGILLEGMLSFLLFAGALHTDLDKLRDAKWPVLSFATLGILIATFVIGTLLYYLLQVFDFDVPYIYCLLFGALISPTDPIAVMGTLKKANVPKVLETKIIGESLFNDGIGVVIFLTLFQIAQKGAGEVGVGFIVELFAMEVFGGVILGFVIGYLGLQMMKRIDHYQTEILITLAVVMGGYSLAHVLHFSGPLAMVVAGLLIGNYGEKIAMSDITLDYVTKFWEIVDEILNAVLFVLIGLEILLIRFEVMYLVLGLIVTVIVLSARYFSLWITSETFGFKKTFVPNTLKIMTWGGLRGGISIALALSLQAYMAKELILSITYVVVLFSLIIQGLTVEKLIKGTKVEEAK